MGPSALRREAFEVPALMSDVVNAARPSSVDPVVRSGFADRRQEVQVVVRNVGLNWANSWPGVQAILLHPGALQAR